jgi:Xaa-Pro aminopeptidase
MVGAAGQVVWFVECSRLEPGLRARLEGFVTVLPPWHFEPFLAQNAAQKRVGSNLRRTPHRLGAIIGKLGILRDEATVARWRWKKHPAEIQCAREGHFRDGQAVIRFFSWLQRAVRERIVTELDAAKKLAELRREIPGYLGPSMPLMSASGPNGAMAHYAPTERSNRRLNDHPIYWMDSGGHYLGCSTDNTVCIAVGTPEQRHILAHTLVVKGYIALASARFPEGTHSNQLDAFARQYLWDQGLDYSHGTGHGVGNFMNIHEGPLILRNPDHFMVAPLESGMIVTNEPGYYLENDYGLRIESHMVTVASKYNGFLEFETISRIPIDPRLIDRALLTSTERRWLEDYHHRIAENYRGCFDQETSEWLENIAKAHVAAG